jgi:hypothetical protein
MQQQLIMKSIENKTQSAFEVDAVEQPKLLYTEQLFKPVSD